MRTFLVALLAMHGAIHLVEFAKRVGFADGLDSIQPPRDPSPAFLWLIAACGLYTSAALLVVVPEVWWMAAVPALLVSQIAIVSSWRNTKLGTVANLLVAVPLMLSVLSARPWTTRPHEGFGKTTAPEISLQKTAS